MADGAAEARWRSEAAFFDEEAEAAARRLRRFDALTLARYRAPRTLFAPEHRFAVLGDLRGRRVLDVGCGDGEMAVLMALLGARVVGLDLSAGALALARRRAELHGVAGAVELVRAPIEAAGLPPRSFDVVHCDAILHHLVDDLDGALARLAGWTAPGGRFVAVEPVSLWPPLRRLRARLPLATAHTPGERPLEDADLAVVRRHVPNLRMRLFRLLGRLDRFILPDGEYEHAAPARRAAHFALAQVDRALLAVPALRRLGSVAVMWG